MYEEQCGEDVLGLRGLIENSLMLSIICFLSRYFPEGHSRDHYFHLDAIG